MRKTKTQTWLNVKQTWAIERKLNPKLEKYEHQQLDKMLQILYTEIRAKDGFEYEPESLKSTLAALDRSTTTSTLLYETESFTSRRWYLKKK